MTVVRRRLTEAKAVDTIEGQLALRLADQVSVGTGAALAKLIDEFRRSLAAALAEPAAGADPMPEPDDEVTRARRAHQEARRAAGLPPVEDVVTRARRRRDEAAAAAAAEFAAREAAREGADDPEAHDD